MVQKRHNVLDQELKAYEYIKSAIINSKMLPGYRLVERDLAQHLNMSRTPIRGAINKLIADNLVTKVLNKGVTVSLLETKELVDLLFVREALESMLARLAAINRTERQKCELESIIAAMKKELKSKDSQIYYKLSGQLHRLIFSAACNKQLFELAVHVNNQVARYQFMNLSLYGRVEKSYQEHRGIVIAICKKDSDMAEKLMKDHIQGIRMLIFNRLGDEKKLIK